MDYKKIHDSIIASAKNRNIGDSYFELHHVIPKSMGGSNIKSNLVCLTAREHYLIHWLLYKIYKNKQMAFAWYRMTHGKSSVERYTSASFIYARKARSEEMSKLFNGKKLSEEHKEKLSIAKRGKTYSEIGRGESPLIGRNLSEDHKRKVGITSLGRRHSDETRAFLSEGKKGNKNPMYGKVVSEETRRKLSEAARRNSGKPISEETRKKLSDSMKAARARKHWSSK